MRISEAVNQMQELDPDHPESAWYVFERISMPGDFDGNGEPETWYESVLSRKTGRFIDSLEYENYPGGFYDPYGGMVDGMCELDPAVKLKTTDDLPALELDNGTCQIFGIWCAQNLGNINEKEGDELALIIDHADFSSLNSCRIYSLDSSGWSKIFSFNVHESVMYNDELDKPDMGKVLRRKSDGWEYRFDNYIDEPFWCKLNF